MNVQEKPGFVTPPPAIQPKVCCSTAARCSMSAPRRSPPRPRRRPKRSTLKRAFRRPRSTPRARKNFSACRSRSSSAASVRPIHDVTEVCYTLGRACASTAMIFAMHQTKVACLIRHGTGSHWHEALMRRVASEQLLLASSTTEGQNGGNIRSSAAAVERELRRDLACSQRHGDFLRRRGRRHRHHRAPHRRRRRFRSGAVGHDQGQLHARAHPGLGDARHARHLQRGF